MGEDIKDTIGADKGSGAAPAAVRPAAVKEHKIIRKIRSMPRWRYCTVMSLAVLWLFFQLYIKIIGPFDHWVQYPVHLCAALVMVFMLNPMADIYQKRIYWMYDIFLIGSVGIVLWYFLSNADIISQRVYGSTPLTDTEIFVALLLMAAVLEAVRRVVSTSLLIIILVFVGYAWFGKFIPGYLHHNGISFGMFCETVMFGEYGIFGPPLSASLNTLFYFLLFGCFFSSCGGGAVLMDVGLKLSDRLIGGPAKAAVISSGLMGMVSGSAVANVSGTGEITIPLMKKAGYTPEEAGSIEALASTGGQLMPPIMGAGAFIMAELLGTRYAHIAAAALLPALAYFTAAYMLVHLISKKKKIGRHSGLHVDEKPILPRLYRLIPVVVLVIMLVIGYSFPGAAIICTVLSIFISMLSEETRRTPKRYAAILLNGIRHAANIAVPTAACGMIMGVALKTDIAFRILAMFKGLGLFPVLLITALVCLMLGMALPTVAAYLIAYTLFLPSIRVYGVSEMAANLFIFYFGVVAQITPPVCPASFTAAKIAGGNAWQTGWKAYSYAAVEFIIPFIFIGRSALLLRGTPYETAEGCLLLIAAICWFAGAVSGYMFRDLNRLERILFALAAVMFVLPHDSGLYAGIVLGGVMSLYCWLRERFESIKVGAQGSEDE